MRKGKSWLFHLSFLLLLLCLTGVDQWSKFLAEKFLKGQKSISLIPGIFQFSYLQNRGAAFGILQNQRWIFLIISVLLLACVIYIYRRMPRTSYYLPLYMVGAVLTAGGLGNTIDRLFRGYVVDFFYFERIDFPIFNVADIYMVVGCILLILLIFTLYKNEEFEFLRCKKRDRKD